MKTIYNKSKLFFLGVLGLSMFVSCADQNDVHQEFIKDGETFYTNKVDSITSFSGKNRVQISGYITSAFSVSEIVVSYDQGNSEQVFTYEKSEAETDQLNLMVTDLEEKNYEFEVFSRDAHGNISVPVSVFASSYGEKYRSLLESRPVNSFSYSEGDATVTFGLSNEYQRKSEVTYTNNSGEETIIEVAKDESETVLTDVSLDAAIMVRTYYVPTQAIEGEETSIDQFESDWKNIDLPAIPSILETTSFASVLGGVEASWSNPDGLNLQVTFSFTAGGAVKTQTVTSSDINGKAVVSGMEEGEQIIEVTMADLYGNSFGPKEFTVTPEAAVLLDKSAWTVVEYSSDEPTRKALHTIDGDLSTFWHTDWSNQAPPYPHHFVIDMGAEKTITSFEVFRRQGDSRGQTKHQFLISMDGETWTDLGSYNMNPQTNDGQVYAMPQNPKARYFKYVALEGPNFYAFLAEINVYGLE
ncbi:hypothetical protein HCG49_14740 [Arenibacter sp. 6A1]|uniref:DUF4998 domain-containing protein n=1 Tax=Arenibacter sp. 6A1 TaxID=2720391 RepID=UPI0014467FD6|nr:DUF4998 domain-containing protein [Arenibacter sp. 6A1]NKI27820.1 hypothetical protein [Arenibacter sp. 6A1]